MMINRKIFLIFLRKVTENKLYEIEKNNIKKTMIIENNISFLLNELYNENTKKIKKAKEYKPINKEVIKKGNSSNVKKRDLKRKYTYINTIQNNNEKVYEYNVNNTIVNTIANTNSFCSPIFNTSSMSIKQTNDTLYNSLKTAMTTILLYIYDINNNNNNNFINTLNIIYGNVNIKQDFVIKDLFKKIVIDSFNNTTTLLNKLNFIKTLKNFDNNNFIHTTYKKEIIDIYLTTLRLCLFFERKSINYKKTKYELFNTCDLLTNSIETLTHCKKFILYQNNKKYVFNIDNFLKHIEKKLLYQEYYECYPCKITNPYTNIELKQSELYELYFHCINNYINIPLPFTLLFKCNMNYVKMLNIHMVYLQNEGLKNTIKNMTDGTKLYYLKDLFNNVDFKNILDFNLLNMYYKSNNDKITFLKKEIEYYVFYNYSINVHTMESMYTKLKDELLNKNEYLNNL